MIEIAFVACLIGSPKDCRDHSLLFHDLSLMTCLMRGQAALAAWHDDHRGWAVSKWSCRYPGAAGQDALLGPGLPSDAAISRRS